MVEFTVEPAEDGKRAERVILSRYRALRRGDFYSALRRRDIRVNQSRIHENVILRRGDLVTLYLQIPPLEETADAPPPYRIVYADAQIVVVSKCQGIPVQADRNGEICLLDLIRQEYGQACMLCHRLDRNTGGLTVIGRSESSAEAFAAFLNQRGYRKLYRCHVHGMLAQTYAQAPHNRWGMAVLRGWHFKNRQESLVHIYDAPKPHCKQIETAFRILSYDARRDTSFLEIELMTGRTHQIRAHFAHIGHPVVGDGKYGDCRLNRRFSYQYQALWANALVRSEFVAEPDYEKAVRKPLWIAQLPDSFLSEPDFR